MRLIFVFFFLCLEIAWAVPAGQTLVEQYIQVAQNTDVSRLRGEGSVSCSYVFSNNRVGQDKETEAYGKNQQEAIQNLALLCLKQRCAEIGKWISIGLRQFDSVSSADNVEFLKTQGHSDEVIATILRNQQTVDRAKIDALTCDTATPNARFFVFDTCFANLMICTK